MDGANVWAQVIGAAGLLCVGVGYLVRTMFNVLGGVIKVQQLQLTTTQEQLQALTVQNTAQQALIDTGRRIQAEIEAECQKKIVAIREAAEKAQKHQAATDARVSEVEKKVEEKLNGGNAH